MTVTARIIILRYFCKSSNLSRGQKDTACRLGRTSTVVDLTNIDWNADKSVAVVSTLTATLKLSRTSHYAVGILVTRRVRERTAINRYENTIACSSPVYKLYKIIINKYL